MHHIAGNGVTIDRLQNRITWTL